MSNKKTAARQKIRFRIRKKISGTSEAPRLSVFRSNSEIYAQLIDDNSGLTLASASSKQKATELGIKKVIFDRSGYIYHGRVKAVAEGAREGGLEF